jgi:adenine phosphoribosyltransferase
VSEPQGDAGADMARFVAERLRDVPDFPQPGILFKDIVPLLGDGPSFSAVIHGLCDFARSVWPVDLVAGVEARGFVIASAMAQELGCGMLPVRKAGKLPPPVLRRAYSLEYGTAEVEVPAGILAGRRVFLVDDVLATGGTLEAAAELLIEAGAELAGIATLLELGFLAGRQRVTAAPVRTLLML